MPGVMGSISSAASPSIQQDATGAHESPLASGAKGRGRGQDKLSRSDRRHVFADGRGASDASATKILRDLLLALPASLEGSLCKPLQDRRLQICSARTHWPSVPDGPMRSARLVDAGQAPGTILCAAGCCCYRVVGPRRACEYHFRAAMGHRAADRARARAMAWPRGGGHRPREHASSS